MNTKKILRTLAILMILGSTIGCDQISKHIVRQRIDEFEQIGLFNNYVTLMKVENTGAFLSLGNTLPQYIKDLLLTILPIVALGLALVYLVAKSNLPNLTTVGTCFIVGGGIGNVYDRINYGSVTDFLHINFVLFQTGVFNMADVSITAGVCIVIVNNYFVTKLKYKALDNH